jgi:hypothetical protein
MVPNLLTFLLLLAAVAIVGFFVWSLVILFRQRRVWRAFAAARGLAYALPSRLMECPTVSGTLGGVPFALFGSAHVRPGGRGTATKRTTIEVSVQGHMPSAGVLATGDMTTLAAAPDLNVGGVVPVRLEGFDGPFVARARDGEAFAAYFTPERLAPFVRLAQARGAWVIFLMQEGEALLRLDTPDPLDDRVRLEAAARSMVGAARALAPAREGLQSDDAGEGEDVDSAGPRPQEGPGAAAGGGPAGQNVVHQDQGSARDSGPR